MGFDQSTGEPLAPGAQNGTAILATLEMATETVPGYDDDCFNGQDYDGDGAIVAGMHVVDDDSDNEYDVMASIHIVDDDNDEDEVLYMAAMATSDKERDSMRSGGAG